MAKPIGNLIANLTTYDKVSSKTKARYGPQSAVPPAADPAATPASGTQRSAKFKKRKR